MPSQRPRAPNRPRPMSSPKAFAAADSWRAACSLIQNWTGGWSGRPIAHAAPYSSNAGAMEIRQSLTFDDVMLVPAASSILPGDTDTRARITREIELGIPLISAAMDTVTEGSLAIAMAQAGGLGVIHRNMPIDQQQAEVRKVKKFEAGRSEERRVGKDSGPWGGAAARH